MDVVARMVVQLVNTRHTNVVCASFQGLVMSGHGDALAEVALTVAEMDRPDAIATVSPMSRGGVVFMRRTLYTMCPVTM